MKPKIRPNNADCRGWAVFLVSVVCHRILSIILAYFVLDCEKASFFCEEDVAKEAVVILFVSS